MRSLLVRSISCEVENGGANPKDASRYIFDLIRRADFAPPASHLGDPEHRYINIGTPWASVTTLAWLATSAPPEIKSLFGLLGDWGRKPHPAWGQICESSRAAPGNLA